MWPTQAVSDPLLQNVGFPWSPQVIVSGAQFSGAGGSSFSVQVQELGAVDSINFQVGGMDLGCDATLRL